MRRPSTHFYVAGTALRTSAATVAGNTAGTAPARGVTFGRGNAVPQDVGTLGSAKEGDEDSAQVVLAGRASGVTTAMSQVSAS